MSSEEEAVAWLRRQIEARRALARGTIELGNNAKWVEQSSGVLVTGVVDTRAIWDGTWPMGDSTLTRLMEANDPQDTLARCEAELAILDEHGPYELASDDVYCRTCGSVPQVPYPCPTVCLLASGYRHRPGYAEHWGAQT